MQATAGVMLAGKTWDSCFANSTLVQIPDIANAQEGVDMVHYHRGLGVFGFSATVRLEKCVRREGSARVALAS